MKLSGNGSNGSETRYGNRAEPVLHFEPLNRAHSSDTPRTGIVPENLATGQTPAISRISFDTVVLGAEKAKCNSQSTAAARCYVALYVKYKPGRAEEARQLIREHFCPVDQELNRDILAFDLHMSEWDRVIYLACDTLEQMAWIPSSMMIAWVERFYEREGGKQNGETIRNRYIDMVERCKSEIAIPVIGN